MAKEKKVVKNELAFSRMELSNPRVAEVMSQVKDLKLTAEDKKVIREALKSRPQVETYSMPVRLNMKMEDMRQFSAYVELAKEEKKVSEITKHAAGEIASFAIVKFLKSDSYFKRKYKEMTKEMIALKKNEKAMKNVPVEGKKK